MNNDDVNDQTKILLTIENIFHNGIWLIIMKGGFFVGLV